MKESSMHPFYFSFFILSVDLPLVLGRSTSGVVCFSGRTEYACELTREFDILPSFFFFF
jgi:hypothetical protein